MVCRLSLRKPYQLNIFIIQPHSVNKFSIDIYANFSALYAFSPYTKRNIPGYRMLP